MTTLYSPAVGKGVQTRTSLGTNTVIGKYELGAALAANDVIEMVKIPAGATIDEIILEATDLDTGGTPAIILDVGDGDDADRFIDGSVVGKTGGVDRLGANLGYKYTETDTIDVKVATGPATGAATGTITLCVQYHMEGFN